MFQCIIRIVSNSGFSLVKIQIFWDAAANNVGMQAAQECNIITRSFECFNKEKLSSVLHAS